MTIEYLTLSDRKLAFQREAGHASAPQILFLGGYASDMTGTKASFLAEQCRAANYGFVRFDYSGNGQSSGDFLNGSIGAWFDDACAIFDQLTQGPQIVVGSSMGGWLGLKLALRYPARVQSLIGIAAAPDFTEDLMWPSLTPDQRTRLKNEGVLHDVGHAPLTLHLIEEGRQHLMLDAPLPVTCPVRLLQGMCDTAVPWKHALRIAGRLENANVRVHLVKDGDHSLSRAPDLELLWQTILSVKGPA